jgi:hypothetical protein
MPQLIGSPINLLAPEFGISILAHPICKMHGILKRKNGESAACLKNSVRIFVEKNT